MTGLNFEWDDGKAARNVRMHGVTFEEAETSFADRLAVEASDDRHSAGEQRWVLIGLSVKLRLLTVIYTERYEAIRIISARKSTRTEEASYAAQNFGS